MEKYIFGLFEVRKCQGNHFYLSPGYAARGKIHWHVVGANTDAICMDEEQAKSHALAFTMLSALQMGEPDMWDSLMKFVLTDYPFNMSREDAIKYFAEREKRNTPIEIAKDIPISLIDRLRREQD